jgi:hypothetical protein|tara:strand:- start:2031 stop:2933 length:903 start_codon:yes stop_codon:yes gene_type:complete
MKELKELISFILSESFQSHTFEPVIGDIVANDNPNCKHRGSVGEVLSVQPLPSDAGKTATYRCLNSGESWGAGELLTKTLDQLVPAVSTHFADLIESNIPITECTLDKSGLAFNRLIAESKTLIARGAYKPSIEEVCYIYGQSHTANITEDLLRSIIRQAIIGEKKNTLWGNIAAKKARGEKPAKKGDPDYPDEKSWKAAQESDDTDDDDLNEAEYDGRKVKVNKPTAIRKGQTGYGKKQDKVYVKDGPEEDDVKVVRFGDPDSEIRRDNPAAKKNFRSRHNCDNPGPKTKARYWSCKAW